MLRSILVGIDGSPYSGAALDVGLRLARSHDALLVGLGVVDEPTIRTGETLAPDSSTFQRHHDAAMLHEATRQVESFLARFTRLCAQAQVACKVLEDYGDPVAQIRMEAQRFDLILLGQQTYFRFETQEFADDTLKEFLRHSPRPVLVVPAEPRPGQNVLVAYDGSLPCAKSLQSFVLLGLAQGRQVHVLTVKENTVEGARIADRAVEFLQSHGVTAQRHVAALEKVHAAEAILDHAHQFDAEMLVLGAYGRSALHEFFFGSVTSSILQDSDVPMFMCH